MGYPCLVTGSKHFIAIPCSAEFRFYNNLKADFNINPFHSTEEIDELIANLTIFLLCYFI